MGGIEDSEGNLPGHSADGTEEESRRTQRPVEVDRFKYFETGQLNVVEGPPGTLPQVIGDAPGEPEPGLRDDNLVCLGGPGRPECQHLVQVLLPAPGTARGYAPMRQIRAFCTRLATASELYEVDGDVYACTLRHPPDEQSARLIQDFRLRQKRVAEEMNETSGELNF